MSVQLSSVNAGMPICIAFFPCCAPVLNSTFSPPVAGWQAPPVAPRLSCSQASLGRPFNATKCIAWHRRVECRSPPRPPLSPLFAMPCAQLDSAIEDCILHCTDAASPSLHRNAPRIAAWQRNAMHSTLFTGPRRRCCATQTKFQDREEGPGLYRGVQVIQGV